MSEPRFPQRQQKNKNWFPSAIKVLFFGCRCVFAVVAGRAIFAVVAGAGFLSLSSPGARFIFAVVAGVLFCCCRCGPRRVFVFAVVALPDEGFIHSLASWVRATRKK